MPGAEQLSEIREVIEHDKVACVFSEPQFNPDIIKAVAKDMDIKTGVVDPLGATLNPGKDLYFDLIRNRGISTVDAVTVQKMDIDPIKEFKPGHPMADQDGFIYRAPVNIEEEYVDMLEASRQYQNNVEVISTVRALMLKTASMGK